MFPVTIRTEMRGGWYNVAGYAIEPGTVLDEETAYNNNLPPAGKIRMCSANPMN
ncbi:MAG: hypothetical protein HC804_03080 [Anaerolineae bacterium]|nr:hypothetical protein [Anaerolineae bacterium]